MSSLLKRMLLFVLPLALLFLSVEWYLRTIRTTYTEKEKGLSGSNPELLILGNSHAAYGIDPDCFSREAFNGANIAQSLYFDKRIALKHLPELKNLKFVFISVDYHSLWFSSQEGRDVWSYLGNGIEYKNSLPLVEEYSYFLALKPKIACNFFRREQSGRYDVIRAIDVEAGVDVSKPISKGWFYFVGQDKLDRASVRERICQFERVTANKEEMPYVVADLEDFIQQLQFRGIVPILVTSPCHPEFVKLLDPEVKRQNETIVRNLAKKYDLQYWDYLNFPIPDSGFFNCDHLNYEGAAVFSKALNERLGKEFPEVR